MCCVFCLLASGQEFGLPINCQLLWILKVCSFTWINPISPCSMIGSKVTAMLSGGMLMGCLCPGEVYATSGALCLVFKMCSV